jgi:hypothetical protein
MDKKTDLLLIGPWEKVLQNGITRSQYIHYISLLRQKKIFNKIIYSCSEYDKRAPIKIFDLFIVNKKMNISTLDFQNKNVKNYISNSFEAIKKSKADFIIKCRSDILVKDFDVIQNNIKKNKILIDYSVNHSLLVPFYYPDFLFASDLKTARIAWKPREFNFIESKNNLKFSINPMRSLQAGKINNLNSLPEFLIWVNILRNLKFLKNNSQAQSDIRFNDWKVSVNFIKNKLILVRRGCIFTPNSRFNYSSRFDRLFFGGSVFFHSLFNLLFIFHFVRYLKKSLFAFISKIFQ